MNVDTSRFILHAHPGGPVLAPSPSPSTQLSRHEARITSAEPDHQQAPPALFTLQNNQLALHAGSESASGPRPGEELVLGRHVVEDRSLNPKRVFFLPRGQALGEVKFEARGEGRWGVRVAGAYLFLVFWSCFEFFGYEDAMANGVGSPVGVRNGCLYALLMEDGELGLGFLNMSNMQG